MKSVLATKRKSLAELDEFFAMSLSERVRGTLEFHGRSFQYLEWNDEELSGRRIAFDTETRLIEGPEIPELALATAFVGGDTVYLIHPRKLARFLRIHAQQVFVFHNIAFDYPVVREYLLGHKKIKTANLWQRIVDAGRAGDTMILDQLVRLARGGFPRRRDLSVVTNDWAGISEVDKDDPYRRRYGELIGADWKTVDRGFWVYGSKDPMATYFVYDEQVEVAKRLIRKHQIPKQTVKEFGLLSQKIQVKAACGLAYVHHQGIGIDGSHRDQIEQTLRKDVSSLVKKIQDLDTTDGIFKRYKKTGELQFTPTGKPRVNQESLSKLLLEIANERDIAVPLTEKTQKPSLARSFWQEYADQDPFIATWVQLDGLSKQVQFFAGLKENHIHPRYETLTRTGRTSCHHPNVQQIPRTGSFRQMFRAREYFLQIDFSSLELRTLAGICVKRYGKSRLADVIRGNIDPHCYTAALIQGMELKNFLALKESDPTRFRDERQKAKGIGFGTAGGLGAKSLVAYARTNYGLVLTMDQAEQSREKFLNEAYPEIGKYMASDSAAVLARNLHTTEARVLEAFGSEPAILAAKRIVQGRTTKRDGRPYRQSFVNRVWKTLQRLNGCESLDLFLEQRAAGEKLERRLFFGPMICTTGRVRGLATYTQRRNGPFQADAADGAKLAIWELHKAGYTIAAFVHDEYLIELPRNADHRQEAEKVKRIICGAMETITDTVPIDAEYALTHRWSKDAEMLLDSAGKLIPWDESPKESIREPKPHSTRQKKVVSKKRRAVETCGKKKKKQHKKPNRKQPLARNNDPRAIFSFQPPLPGQLSPEEEQRIEELESQLKAREQRSAAAGDSQGGDKDDVDRKRCC